jgi:hypothetical protein
MGRGNHFRPLVRSDTTITKAQLIQKESTISVLSRIRWLLMKQLAIRLGYQRTIAKSLVIAALPATAVVCFALTASAADEDFSTLTKRLQTEKPKFAKRQQALLAERYDLADRPAKGTTMWRGKPV